jgi:hypothetical protein
MSRDCFNKHEMELSQFIWNLNSAKGNLKMIQIKENWKNISKYLKDLRIRSSLPYELDK